MTSLDDYDYDLPDASIAQVPIEPRPDARLLVDGGAAGPTHRHVRDLASMVGPGDLVVVNDSKVLHARLALRRSTGGAVEVLLLEAVDGLLWRALVRPARRLREGEELWPADPDNAEPDNAEPDNAEDDSSEPIIRLRRRLDDGRFEVELLGVASVDDLLSTHGAVPLPPYITTTLNDPSRYQTVYADRPGSVAAPTAGLHLTHDLLDACRARGAEIATVELAVGIGTFRPITVAHIEDHEMHAERYRISTGTIDAIGRADRVLAVGTTSVRALESWAATGEAEGSSRLFIHGDYEFRVVDRLLTNFHVPRSSLLVMIDAFVGERWRALYRTAVDDGYRFLSFGDAMLLDRGLNP